MSLIKRFDRNTAGRDFAVGDIHGHFDLLQQALAAAGFDWRTDRLFSVGDLVDRGPQSADVDQWLRKPWFHPVRGNHEQMTIDSYEGGRACDAGGLHMMNGGAWFYGLSGEEQGCYSALLEDLPLAIEVETANGLIGIVHADVPRRGWKAMIETLLAGGNEARHVAAMCQWSRTRIEHEDAGGVADVHAVIVGHTPLQFPAKLGNVYHIDTGGWLPHRGGYFTLLDLNTLQSIPPMPAKLDWVDA